MPSSSAAERLPERDQGRDYRRTLRDLAEWEPFLLEQSALPGPRANLELAAAAAEEAEEEALRRWAAVAPDAAPFGSTEEFLPVCGVIGLGRILADGDRSALVDLRLLASDPRWRVREAVAIALQRFGDVDFPALLAEMQRWAPAHCSSAALPSLPSANRGCSPIRTEPAACSHSSAG